MRHQRTYTNPTVTRAVALAVATTTKQASVATGVPYSTLRDWRQRRVPYVRHPKPPKAPAERVWPLQRDILAALRMHGPMTLRDLYDAIDSTTAQYVHVSRSVNRLVKRGLVLRWGSYRPFTYAPLPHND